MERKNQARDFQFDRDLRILQSNSVETIEPIVYQSNHNILSSYGATGVSTIELSSQSSLSSYLPQSGISLLNEVASIRINQIFEIQDATMLGSENRFTVKTQDNQPIFLASEGSSPRSRLLWGNSRPFMLHLTDKNHQQSLTLRRQFGCHCFCFPLIRQCLEVWLQSGILLGVIQERFSLTSREFVIESERGEILYRINVSLGNSLCMPKEIHFRIFSASQPSEQCGTITRHWNSEINSFELVIYFADPSIDSKIKSLFLGLSFLLEYIFFQSRRC